MTVSISNVQVKADVQIKKEDIVEVEQSDVIQIVDVHCDDVDIMNMGVSSGFVSDTRKYALSNQLKDPFRSLFPTCSNKQN